MLPQFGTQRLPFQDQRGRLRGVAILSARAGDWLAKRNTSLARRKLSWSGLERMVRNPGS
jgi:hypothetical protein